MDIFVQKKKSKKKSKKKIQIFLCSKNEKNIQKNIQKKKSRKKSKKNPDFFRIFLDGRSYDMDKIEKF